MNESKNYFKKKVWLPQCSLCLCELLLVASGRNEDWRIWLQLTTDASRKSQVVSIMDTNTGKRAHSMILLTQEAGAGGWRVWSHSRLHKEPWSLYTTHRSRDGGISAIWSQGLEDNCKFKASQSHRFTFHKLSGPFQALICGSLWNISTGPKAWHKSKSWRMISPSLPQISVGRHAWMSSQQPGLLTAAVHQGAWHSSAENGNWLTQSPANHRTSHQTSQDSRPIK